MYKAGLQSIIFVESRSFCVQLFPSSLWRSILSHLHYFCISDPGHLCVSLLSCDSDSAHKGNLQDGKY